MIPSALKDIKQKIEAAVPPGLCCSPSLVGSEKKAMACIFQEQLFYGKGQSHAIGITDYGVGECRIQLCGEEMYVGIPSVTAPGITLEQKAEFLRAANHEDLKKVIEGGGFRVTLSPGQLLAIPPAYVFASVVVDKDEDSCGLRWGCLNVSNERAVDNVLTIVDEMLEMTEGLEHDEAWTGWQSFLRARVEARH